MHCYSSERKFPFRNTWWFKKLTVFSMSDVENLQVLRSVPAVGWDSVDLRMGLMPLLFSMGWFRPMVRQLVGIMPLLSGIFI
jgi:hypothetical protein